MKSLSLLYVELEIFKTQLDKILRNLI